MKAAGLEVKAEEREEQDNTTFLGGACASGAVEA